MQRILLVGAFGQRNPGDEALLDAFDEALAGFDLVVASSDPAGTGARLGRTAIRSDGPRQVARAIWDSDAVVFGGGTVFKTLHPSTGRPPHSLLVRGLAVARAARLRGNAVALVGVGAGTLSGVRARRLAAALAGAADLLVLRDEESARALADCGAPTPLRVGADPAWTLVGAGARGRRDDTVLVALSHLAAHGDGLDALLDRLASVLLDLAAGGTRPLLQPWQVGSGGDDLAMAYALRSRVPGAVVLPPPEDLAEAQATAAAARLAICLRFHAVVAAAAAGTPLVAVAHEAKLAGLARRLGQPAVPVAAPLGALASAVSVARGGLAPQQAAVRAEIALADEGFALLRLLIGGEATVQATELTGLRLEPRVWSNR